MSTALTESDLPLQLIRRGKVREVYGVDDDHILLVASDRVSAFDVVMNEPVMHKGAVLTQMSAYWFRRLADVTPSHFVSVDSDEITAKIPVLEDHRSVIDGRSTLARRTQPLPFECVVRGYLSGSAWAEYGNSGTLAGEPLEKGMLECQKLDPAIFSPATKAETGHDENVTFKAVSDDLGAELAGRLRDLSLELYERGREIAADAGIIIADTKFEFGTTSDGELLLIDEALTPDSSRFWPADRYETGKGQPSFDKQPLRDHLAVLKETGEWDGAAPPPRLPDNVVAAMSRRYLEAYQLITGEDLPGT